MTYALHILNCKHEYGTFADTMTLLKPIEEPSLFLTHEHLYIQLFLHNNQLIPEKHLIKKILYFTYFKIDILRHTSPDISINTSISTRRNQFHSILHTILSVIQVGSRIYQQYSYCIFYTYLLTPWSRVLLEKLTSKLCS